MKSENYMNLEFPSRSANEAFARSAIACFAAQLDPTLDELGDIKTAVSEAVTNCIVHAYPETIGPVILRARLLPDTVSVGSFNSVLKNSGYILMSSSSEAHTKCSLLLSSIKLSLIGAKASGTFI